MSTYNSQSSGRRSGGGGGGGGGRGRGRNRGPRREDDSRQERRPSPAAPAEKAPEKKGFFQKIIAFFKGKPATPQPKERPKYTPRSAEGSGTREKARSESPRADRFEEARPPRPARKPEAIEVTTPKVYVGNLSFDATEGDLSELFNGVGSVVTAEVVAHKQTEKSKGFGFVTLGSIDEARRAVEVLHDKEFMGRKLVVSGAKTPVERE